MGNKVKRRQVKDWVICAGKTFVQASVGAVVILVPTQDWTAVRSALTAVLIGAVSAGSAAVWNLLAKRFGGSSGPPCATPPEAQQDSKS